MEIYRVHYQRKGRTECEDIPARNIADALQLFHSQHPAVTVTHHTSPLVAHITVEQEIDGMHYDVLTAVWVGQDGEICAASAEDVAEIVLDNPEAPYARHTASRIPTGRMVISEGDEIDLHGHDHANAGKAICELHHDVIVANSEFIRNLCPLLAA